MKFVKFSITTPYFGTDYEDYLVYEEDTDEEIITRHCKGLAIEVGNYYKHHLKPEIKGLSPEEQNLRHLEYLQKCMELSKWEYITESDFDVAIDEGLV